MDISSDIVETAENNSLVEYRHDDQNAWLQRCTLSNTFI